MSATEPWVRRLAGRYDAGCWTGIVIRAIPAASFAEDDGGVLRTPDHFIAAAWPPAAQAPSRWPEVVVIGSPAADHALVELFHKLPPHARLFLADREQVDVVLAATILRESDRNLEPYQRAALDAFIAEERRRENAAIHARYTDRDAGYERFRAQVEPPDDAPRPA